MKASKAEPAPSYHFDRSIFAVDESTLPDFLKNKDKKPKAIEDSLSGLYRMGMSTIKDAPLD